MKIRFALYATASYLSLCSAVPSPTRAEPIFTSIKEEDCRVPSSSVTAAYDAEGLTVQECAAVNGWRLLVASSDERSWIDIGRGPSVWSTEREVVYKNDFGSFPNIGGAVAEWGVTAGGAPSYLIFRIAAQSPVTEGTTHRLSRLFVIDLKGQEPTFCGITKTNEEARALATRKGDCRFPLPRKSFSLN